MSSDLSYGDGRTHVGSLPVSLDLRFRTGNRHGFSYAFLFDIDYDASGVIRLMFGGNRVEVRGRNLLELYERLLLHSIGYIQENPKERVPDSHPFIETIEIGAVET
jgi:hypothetical protein